MCNEASRNRKWIVGMMPETEPGVDSNRTMGTIIRLNDPCTNSERDYGLMLGVNSIVEIQSLPANFSSFVVGRHIVKDGSLYILNRIDPLFFYLATQPSDDVSNNNNSSSSSSSSSSNKKQQTKWEDFDQLLENSQLPPSFHQVISEDAMKHICSTFCNDGSCYFKFSCEKALVWLKRKQEKVLASLIAQDIRKKTLIKNNMGVVNNNASNSTGGSISDNFNLPPQQSRQITTALAVSSVQDQDKRTDAHVTQPDTKSLRFQSIQITCNYLNEGWSKEFVRYLGCKTDVLSSTKTVAAKKVAGVSTAINKNTDVKYSSSNIDKSSIQNNASKRTLPSASRTVGNKRLSTVNTKGMKRVLYWI